MKSIKLLLATVFCLIISSTSFLMAQSQPTDQNDFLRQKSEMDAALNQEISCINAAQNNEAIDKCHKEKYEALKRIHDQHQNNHKPTNATISPEEKARRDQELNKHKSDMSSNNTADSKRLQLQRLQDRKASLEQEINKIDAQVRQIENSR